MPEIAHEQIIFEDDPNIPGNERRNIGFMSTSSLETESDVSGYRATRTGFDDAIMREAVLNLNPNYISSKPYQLLWITLPGTPNTGKNNCQDWAEEVRNEYDRLKRQKAEQAQTSQISNIQRK